MYCEFFMDVVPAYTAVMDAIPILDAVNGDEVHAFGETGTATPPTFLDRGGTLWLKGGTNIFDATFNAINVDSTRLTSPASFAVLQRIGGASQRGHPLGRSWAFPLLIPAVLDG